MERPSSSIRREEFVTAELCPTSSVKQSPRNESSFNVTEVQYAREINVPSRQGDVLCLINLCFDTAEYAKLPLIRPYLEPGFSNYTNGVNFASAGAGVLPETRPGTVRFTV